MSPMATPSGCVSAPRNLFTILRSRPLWDRHRRLFVGHRLKQRWTTRSDARDAAFERSPQFARLLYPLGMNSERRGDAPVVAAEPVGVIAGHGLGHVLGVSPHQAVVQDDGQDRDAATHGGLEVHADHAEGS